MTLQSHGFKTVKMITVNCSRWEGNTLRPASPPPPTSRPPSPKLQPTRTEAFTSVSKTTLHRAPKHNLRRSFVVLLESSSLALSVCVCNKFHHNSRTPSCRMCVTCSYTWERQAGLRPHSPCRLPLLSFVVVIFVCCDFTQDILLSGHLWLVMAHEACCSVFHRLSQPSKPTPSRPFTRALTESRYQSLRSRGANQQKPQLACRKQNCCNFI